MNCFLLVFSILGAFASAELPITVAGPGFVVEALAATTMSTYYFPEAEKYLKTDRWMRQLRLQETGMVVRARLFAPPGRTLQSVASVRVIKATDDKGRILAGPRDESGSTEAPLRFGSSKQVTSLPITLRLPLPPPDARSIDELAGEAIALTTGHWKELRLTNVQENATNAIDLIAVLPGATMFVTKVDSTSRQLTIQARIQGPPAIRQLHLEAPFSSAENWDCQVSDQDSSNNGDPSTRKVTIHSYSYSADEEEPTGPLTLVVRHPEDQRRERVTFRLTALDLF